jgi:hypothetical protein
MANLKRLLCKAGEKKTNKRKLLMLRAKELFERSGSWWKF